MQEVLLFLKEHQGFEFYSFLTLALIASGCYFPISSDLVIITITALAAATGLYQIPLIFICIFSGILIGDLINFGVAKKYGPQVLKSKLMQKVLKPAKVDRMTRLLQRFGEKYIFIIRFMPLIRTVLYFSAGLMQFSTWKFILYNSLSSIIYLVGLMSLSYKIGADINKLRISVLQFQLLFAGLVILALALAIYLRKRRRLAFHKRKDMI